MGMISLIDIEKEVIRQTQWRQFFSLTSPVSNSTGILADSRWCKKWLGIWRDSLWNVITFCIIAVTKKSCLESHPVYLVDSLTHYVVIKWKSNRIVEHIAFQGFEWEICKLSSSFTENVLLPFTRCTLPRPSVFPPCDPAENNQQWSFVQDLCMSKLLIHKSGALLCVPINVSAYAPQGWTTQGCTTLPVQG